MGFDLIMAVLDMLLTKSHHIYLATKEAEWPRGPGTEAVEIGKIQAIFHNITYIQDKGRQVQAIIILRTYTTTHSAS